MRIVPPLAVSTQGTDLARMRKGQNIKTLPADHNPTAIPVSIQITVLLQSRIRHIGDPAQILRDRNIPKQDQKTGLRLQNLLRYLRSTLLITKHIRPLWNRNLIQTILLNQRVVALLDHLDLTWIKPRLRQTVTQPSVIAREPQRRQNILIKHLRRRPVQFFFQRAQECQEPQE